MRVHHRRTLRRAGRRDCARSAEFTGAVRQSQREGRLLLEIPDRAVALRLSAAETTRAIRASRLHSAPDGSALMPLTYLVERLGRELSLQEVLNVPGIRLLPFGKLALVPLFEVGGITSHD